MDGLLPLFRVTPATEVAKKWNVTAERLNEIVNKCGFSLYIIRDKRIRPDNGEIVYFCQGPYHSLYHETPFGEGYYELEGIYFDANIIELYENAYPDILWASPDANVTREEESEENTPADTICNTVQPLHSGLKIISAYEVIRRLMITPYELVEILNGKYVDDGHGNERVQRLVTTQESRFKNFTYNEDYFTEDNLGKVKIYQQDFDKYCEQWGIESQAVSGSEDINIAVRERDAKILRLEQKCEEQQKIIGQLEAQLSVPRGFSPEKRTDAANDARAEKKLAAWKELFPCMVRIYARMEQGRQYQKKEMAELFTAEGVNLKANGNGIITDERLRYFWQTFVNSGLPISDLTKCGLPDESSATITDMGPDVN